MERSSCGLSRGRVGAQALKLGVLTVGILAEMGEECQAWRKRGLPWGGGRDQLESPDSSEAGAPRAMTTTSSPGQVEVTASRPPQACRGSPSPSGEVVFPWESSLAWSLAPPSSPKGN